MTTYYVDWDERYPDFSLSATRDTYKKLSVELTEEEYVEWVKACYEYNKWQDRLDELRERLYDEEEE